MTQTIYQVLKKRYEAEAPRFFNVHLGGAQGVGEEYSTFGFGRKDENSDKGTIGGTYHLPMVGTAHFKVTPDGILRIGNESGLKAPKNMTSEIVKTGLERLLN